ncbi:hypothetical protein SAMN02745116_00780 [Pilibacter termitis]|uniref:Uncharacterized protein n=1 Tax=Pilibacter termitis TaxID=263852 RepID=A0A1T4LRM9_9ENTE|nr:hypothetical protein [Pilibacter termitis]SJZ57353.1 hypothetical protein SAMN02745116_00780 [Pilibacter termitis]
MSLWDKLIIAGVCLAIVLGVLLLVNVVVALRRTKDIKEIAKKRFKKESTQKKQQLLILHEKRKREKNVLISIFLFVFTLLSLGGAWYAYFWQSTNLTQADVNAFVNGYYYVDDLQTALKSLKESGDEKKYQNEIHVLSNRLTNYGIIKADTSLSVEGQQLLNHYYAQLKELGVSMSNQLAVYLNDGEVQKDVERHVERIKGQEKKIIQTYKINEQALNTKK